MSFYAGRGDRTMYADYMTLINKSFEFDDGERGFLSLLPKLYKPEYDPAAQNYVVRAEDGSLKAAVGAFDSEAVVAGKTLKTRGIGNVCVIHDARHEGYMKLLMDMAIDDMARDGVDFSALGGRRMRYRYFSFDIAAPEYRFNFERPDLEHYFGAGRGDRFDFTEITSSDANELDGMAALFASQPFHTLRGGRERFFDTLKTWRERVFAARDRATGRLAGYSVGHESICELMLADESYLDDYIFGYMKAQELDGLRVSLPYYRKRLASRLLDYAAESGLGNSEQYTILNFKNVTEAFLRLAGTETELADGRVVLLIHGRAGDELFEVAVSGGEVTVGLTMKTPDFELSHFEAINMLFAAVSTSRDKLPPAVKSWLPLPLFTYHSDAV